MKERTKKRKYVSTKAMDLPTRFVPKFLDDADGRPHVIRVLRNRLQQLKDDAGVDSFQKDLLAQRAIFIAAKLETMEVEAMTNNHIDFGSYTQATNCLIGLLKCLGLSRKAKEVESLQHYVKKRKKS
jgi:hypothetical protein